MELAYQDRRGAGAAGGEGNINAEARARDALSQVRVFLVDYDFFNGSILAEVLAALERGLVRDRRSYPNQVD